MAEGVSINIYQYKLQKSSDIFRGGGRGCGQRCPKSIEKAWLCMRVFSFMPAALVECAFIDNDWDALLLMNQQTEIAAAIARGVTDYWQKISREE